MSVLAATFPRVKHKKSKQHGANLTMISMNMEHSLQFIHGYLVRQIGSDTSLNISNWNHNSANTAT